jgi:hypothetical protein
MHENFSKFNIGHLLIIITILYAAFIIILNSNQIKLMKNDDRHDAEFTDLRSRVEHLEWYKEQGIDFKHARELGIKPPIKPTK